MATQDRIAVVASQTSQEHHYSNVYNRNYYNIVNNYNGDHYDYRRQMNNHYHHRHRRTPRYHMNYSNHNSSNRDNYDWDLTISSTYNNGFAPIYPYLESNAITAWFTANTHDTFGILPKPYIHYYILETSILHDEWYRNCYELSIWEEYLKMGKENKYWAEEVLRYTKIRNFKTNMRFIQTQINQFEDEIIEISRSLNDFMAQLITHWKNDRSIPTRRFLRILDSLDTEETTAPSTATTTQKRIIECAFDLNSCIREYFIQCTQYAKKLAMTKIQLAQAQLKDFRRL